MGIRSLSTASISTGTKRSKVWDQSAVVITNSYESIATVTAPSGSVSSITFSSIPQTYKHLQIRAFAPSGSYMNLQYNGDTTSSNYRAHYLIGTGSSFGYGTNANAAYFPEAGGWSSPWVAILDILDYTNTNKYKVGRDFEGFEANGSGEIYLYSTLWMSTAAITSITLSRAGATVGQYSSFALYGIKG